MKAPGLLGGQGNEATQRRILHYLRGGRVHPGILLVGPDTEVKWEVAKGMAKFLLGRLQPERAASIATRVERDLHPDVLCVREEEEDTIKIEVVRQICHQMEVSPIEAEAKVCLINECHRMNKAAANAFLKTLEEPGPDRYFILMTSQPGSLLPTILSRCVQFTFKPDQESSEISEAETFESALQEMLTTGDPSGFVQGLRDKETCVQFARYLQGLLREHIVALETQANPRPWLRTLSRYRALERFEGAVELEGQLRTHANHALLVEGWLRSHWISPAPSAERTASW